MNPILESTAEALRARGFEAMCFASGQDAAAFVLSDLLPGESVGIGGSATVKELGLDALLREAGHPVFWHWGVPPEEMTPQRMRAMNASAYVCSANALTHSGLMVQIDGNGNRVAAMCYGPQTVYVIVGKNKLVSGGYAQAVERIKQVACPKNARRQGLDTPCANGHCNVKACQGSMCHVFASFELAPNGNTTKVLLVDEELGY